MNPKDFSLKDSIGYWARKVAQTLTNDLNRRFQAEGLGVTVEQWRVLVNLREKDGLTQQELCERLLQEKTSVSRLINGLENKNLVVRVPDQLDRRNKRIYLSKLGKSLQDSFVEQALKTLEKAQEGISEEELQACRETLRRIVWNIMRE